MVNHIETRKQLVVCFIKNRVPSQHREKKWVDLGLSNSLKVYKWVPGKPHVYSQLHLDSLPA